MKISTSLKIKSILLIIFLKGTCSAQVGVNTTIPEAMLDVNGNLRVQTVINSDSTNDVPLVIDDDGIIKRNISATEGSMHGSLSSSFNTGYYSSNVATPNAQGIFKINTIQELIDRGNDYNDLTDTFIAPIDGTYEVTITITAVANDGAPNYVCGLVGPDGKWVMRFSMSGETLDEAGSSAGYTYSFSGIASLTSGQGYFFGVARDGMLLLSNPGGSTGRGIGSYFKIKLIDN